MNDLVKGWHFTTLDKRLRYSDGRIVRAGRTLKAKFPYVYDGITYDGPVLCFVGLHASVNILDALKYAPGPYLWRVELSGSLLSGADKLVAIQRKALWGFDATNLLREFARKCALDVIHLWDAPEIMRQYLVTGEKSLQDAASAAASAAAWAAASDAAWAAAWAAASAAASDAASAAASDAARDAASAAAWAAASDAAWAAASDAAWAKQEKTLRKLVKRVADSKGCQL